MSAQQPAPELSSAQRHGWLRIVVIGVGLAVLNVVLFLLLPPDLLERLGSFGYFGAFVSALVANASVLIPVPYYPLLIRLSQAFDPVGVLVAAAVGSAVGELVAYAVGKSGRSVVETTRFYLWVQRQLSYRWRAPLVLFALSAPPNPFFDVAGLLAGALGIPVWLFFSVTVAGRLVRMGIVIGFGLWIT
jgi:membrane protein YqaA with SNARE-associated domain